MRRPIPFATLLLALMGGAMPAQAQSLDVRVSAPDRSYRETPITFTVPSEWVPPIRLPRRGDVLAQVESAGPGRTQVTFIVPDLKQGESRTYRLYPAKAHSGSGVEVKRDGANAEIRVGGRLFTRYDTTTGPNKPYFYPLNAPDGQQIVRHGPIEKREGETTDHPHHRGLWFTHGDVNGVDFWLESKGAGKTAHTGYEALESGPVYGLMRAKTDWLAPDGKKIAEDARTVRVYNTRDGQLMDFTINVTPVGGPLVWGDTKEGTFGLRVADSMRANAGKGKIAEGQIVNSEGVKGAATWGKRAAWVDYFGPVEGKTVGVAILDHPSNLRHPTYWHVRDYGLFAANPFGIHDFDPAQKSNRRAGEVTTPLGQSQTFRYRLYLHNGTTEDAKVADVWNAYATPPTVTVLKPKGKK
ncbi:MAG: PmoA family protein [Armatimonadetes bacterium]|nr:PmoA family protein [Armatimonadota bacterium]